MRLIGLEERKQIQMEILDAVDRFCSLNNIRYSLGCGSLIGAVRHGGYIPWDDDIDIHMLRDDYTKFEQEFPEVFEGKYKFISLHRDSKWGNLFGKVYDDRTIVQEKILNALPIGINIDIFPLDEVPDDENEWNTFNAKRWKDFETTRHSQRKMSSHRSFLQNLFIFISKLPFIFFDQHNFALKRERFVIQNNNRGYKRLYLTSYGQIGHPFPKTVFDELVDMPFEDRHYKCFKDYDIYLTSIFGDYMTLPPIEKRISFHTYDTYWKD